MPVKCNIIDGGQTTEEMNKHKKFIKYAYEGKYGTMCQDWKDTILEHYPEFKEEEFKVGDWVVVSKKNCTKPNPVDALVVYRNDGKETYGFSHIGDWTRFFCTTNDMQNKSLTRKATPKEVEEHLIEEAKKRGLYDSNLVKCLSSGKINIKNVSLMPVYDKKEDELWSKYALVYEKGKWAEIIPTITKEEAEEKLGCKIV